MAKQSGKAKNFEISLEELEEVVGSLEDGKLDLDDSLVLFEKGVGLYKDCKGLLDKAEKKISKLSESLREEEI